MSTPSLIIPAAAYQNGAYLGYRPSLNNPNKVIPVECTYVCASSITRRNKAGIFVQSGVNTPALEWVNNKAWWNFPVQRTNSFVNNVWEGLALPTNWNNGNTDGTREIVPSLISPLLSARRFTVTDGSNSVESGAIAVVNGSTYTISVYIEAVSGNIPASAIARMTGGPTGTTTYFMNGVQILATDFVTIGRYELRFASTATSSHGVRIGCGNGVSVTGSVTLSGPQHELGAYASPVILTSGTALTRVIANPNTSGLTSFIGQQEGGWYTEFRTGSVLPTNGDIICINQTVTNSIVMWVASGALRLRIHHNSNSFTITGPALAANTTYKIGIRYQSGNSVMYVNGTPYTNSDAFTFTAALTTLAYPNVFFIGERYPLLFGQNQFYLTPPSNAELLALTTL